MYSVETGVCSEHICTCFSNTYLIRDNVFIQMNEDIKSFTKDRRYRYVRLHVVKSFSANSKSYDVDLMIHCKGSLFENKAYMSYVSYTYNQLYTNT